LDIAYVISAYKLPEQLVRLVRRLEAPGARFVIHVDRKTPEPVFSRMTEGTRSVTDVTFLPRHVCRWGGFGHVRATLKGIERLVADAVPFDYAILLTGQDYPLVGVRALTRFFESAGGRSYMRWRRLPVPGWSGRGGLDRIESWHALGPHRSHLRLPLRRRLPASLEPYGGSPYWCFARPLVEYVHDFTQRHPEVVRFFEHTYIPDELFFQTIVLNSPHAETVLDENLRYIDWAGDPAPRILTTADLPVLDESGKLFARKFDEQVDAEVLRLIDERMDREEATS
jgi:hypothetical protein